MGYSLKGRYRVALVGGAGSWGRHYLQACPPVPSPDLRTPHFTAMSEIPNG